MLKVFIKLKIFVRKIKVLVTVNSTKHLIDNPRFTNDALLGGNSFQRISAFKQLADHSKSSNFRVSVKTS